MKFNLDKLINLSNQGLLPHAWLFDGICQTEKAKVSKEFCQWLLCENKFNISSCMDCKSCNLYQANTHPDFLKITANNEKNIGIDELRKLISFTQGKPQLANCKAIIVEQAEFMTVQAANAFLKTLEDPVGCTYLFIMINNYKLLPKTIVSRCQRLVFNAREPFYSQEQIEKIKSDLYELWVTKKYTEIETVEKWQKNWGEDILQLVWLVLAELIRDQYITTRVNEIYQHISLKQLWLIFDKITQSRRWLLTGHKPNTQLLLEEALLCL